MTPARARARVWAWAAAAVGIYAAIVAVTYAACVARTGGAFVYPIDDAYIHLAIAKNLAASGTYGVTSRAFAPASSSVLWPVLLAGLRLAGLRDAAPLAVDVALGAVLVATVVVALHDEGLRGAAGAAAAVAIAVAIPLVPLVFSGMEHVLHAVATLWLALAATRAIAADRTTRADAIRVALLAALAASARYEALALAAFLAAAFAFRRRWIAAAGVVAGAAAPLVAEAVFASAHGGPLVPVSILLKRSRADAWTWPAVVYYRLLEAPHVLALLALLAAVTVHRHAARRAPRWDRRSLLVGAAFATLAAHVAAAQVGWFYRYEAYAMALGLVAVAAAAPELGAHARAYAVPLAIVTLPITGRGIASLRATPPASSNIYGQQMQMAAFLRDFYPGERVVVNDIGAVSYLTDVDLIDLVGLGSLDVARAKGMRIDQPLTRDQIETLTRGARIAIVYEDWFAAALPPSWRRAGRWRIHDNHVCAKDTVSFYSIARDEDEPLAAHLRSFAPRLPPSVDDVDRAR